MLGRAPLAVLFGLVLVAPASTWAHGGEGDAHVDVLVTGLLEPVHVAFDGVDPDRMYVSERAGRVLVYDLGAGAFVADALGQPKAFLDLRGLAGSWFQEMGLLSIAFHPDFATNRHVYVGWVDQGLVNHLDRFTVGSVLDPDVVDLASRSPVLTQTGDVFFNHNGGGAVFGPDGYLYYGIGDGGLADDPLDNAQNVDNWFGKLLRLDVDSVDEGYAIPPDNPFAQGGGAPEIWAYGLRNPWRYSFDGDDLWIGDVGQNQWEEIDLAVGNPAGVNYGWPRFEGSHAYLTSAHAPPGAPVGPVTEYGHNEGCSVTGGFVVDGRYVFGDYCSRRIWSFDAVNGRQVLVADSGADISSMGLGPDGTVYVVALGLQSDPLGGWVGRLAR